DQPGQVVFLRGERVLLQFDDDRRRGLGRQVALGGLGSPHLILEPLRGSQQIPGLITGATPEEAAVGPEQPSRHPKDPPAARPARPPATPRPIRSPCWSRTWVKSTFAFAMSVHTSCACTLSCSGWTARDRFHQGAIFSRRQGLAGVAGADPSVTGLPGRSYS